MSAARRPAGVAIALLLLATLPSGCATPAWSDGAAAGKISNSTPLPTTLFMPAVAATDPCAATRLAVAMGVSRRGYYVLAQPAELQQAYVIELQCSETTADVPLVVDEQSTESKCVAPRLLHLRLSATLRTPRGGSRGPVTFEGRQKLFPGQAGEPCRFEVEPVADLRRRAGEAIGWRLPPGSIDSPGADPRLILAAPAAGAPHADPAQPTPAAPAEARP